MKINIGGYTRQVTRAAGDRETVVEQCRQIASKNNLVILVKRDCVGRWQGFAKRHNARGARFPQDYDFLPTGRRARRIDHKVPGGCVYVADTSNGCGSVRVQQEDK